MKTKLMLTSAVAVMLSSMTALASETVEEIEFTYQASAPLPTFNVCDFDFASGVTSQPLFWNDNTRTYDAQGAISVTASVFNAQTLTVTLKEDYMESTETNNPEHMTITGFLGDPVSLRNRTGGFVGASHTTASEVDRILSFNTSFPNFADVESSIDLVFRPKLQVNPGDYEKANSQSYRTVFVVTCVH